MGYSGDTFLDMRAAKKFDHADLLMLDALFDCVEEPLPLVNIITRLHGKEKYFNVMIDSVNEQDYEEINHILGSDIPCSYCECTELQLEEPHYVHVPQGHYYAGYNLHCETLAKEVTEGWVCFLDEDDRLTSKTSISEIVREIDNENELLVWRVQILPNWIVPSYSFGKEITFCDFSGIGMMFHSKHLPVTWSNLSGGDYHVAKELVNRGLEVKWIDKVLSTTQEGPHGGK